METGASKIIRFAQSSFIRSLWRLTLCEVQEGRLYESPEVAKVHMFCIQVEVHIPV